MNSSNDTVATPASSIPEWISSAQWWNIYGRRRAMLGASIASALEALWANRLRSFLTMLGLIIGVAAFIAVVTLTQGAAAQLSQELTDPGIYLVNISPSSAVLAGVKAGAGTLPSIHVSDASALATIPHVLNVSPSVFSPGEVIYGDQNWNSYMNGVSYTYSTMIHWDTREGSWWSASDEQQSLPVVVLGQTIVDNTFALTGTDPVGQTIRINRQIYRVVGVLTPRGVQNGNDQDDIMFAPYTALLHSTGHTYVNNIFLQADSIANLDQIQQDATRILEQQHHLQSGTPDDFQIRTALQGIQAQQESDTTLTVLFIGIATISLIVGGIGIMNIMLVSVTERTREIGLRAAVGAQPSDIRDQFLIEAVTLSCIGGAIGLLIGVVTGNLLTAQAGFPFVLSPFSVLLAFGVAAFTGIVFGFYPAIRASQLDPIVALRIE